MMGNDASSRRAPPDWLRDAVLRRIFSVLGEGNVRVVGGAVRNTLMGLPVHDIDLAARTTPEENVQRLKRAGFSIHAPGLEHGTIIAAKDGRAFEITTLRRDIETDGRHARVAFTTDWHEDAARRDFTINALYMDAKGRVHDPVGGLADIAARRIRFIGDAAARIREDYLRILRYFRFWARYAAQPPDAETLQAIADLAPGLRRISKERIGGELRRLLVAPKAAQALHYMQRTGVLREVFPAACRQDFAALERMLADDARHHLAADWLLRLAAFCGLRSGMPRALQEAFRLSRKERQRLDKLAQVPDVPGDIPGLRRLAWRLGSLALLGDVARLRHAQGKVDGNALERALKLIAELGELPAFPLGGRDVLALGVAPGRQVRDILGRLAERWAAAGFHPAGREQLLEWLKQEVEGGKA